MASSSTEDHSNAPKPVIHAAVVDQPSFKFSYQPKSHERSYYEGLFRYVASLDDSQSHDDEILQPKIVAKLFVTSKVPTERLRQIWNMATALEDGIIDDNRDGFSRNTGDDHSDSSANFSFNKSSSNRQPPIRVMTQTQFQTAVRLIQLYQNRIRPMDRYLNVSKTALRTIHRDCEVILGTNFNFFKKEFPPAYFAGVSGIHVALPGAVTSSSGGIRNKDSSSMRRMTDPDVFIGGNDVKHDHMTFTETELTALRKEFVLLRMEVKELKAIINTHRPMNLDGGLRRASADHMGSSNEQKVLGSDIWVHHVIKKNQHENDHGNARNRQDDALGVNFRVGLVKNRDLFGNEYWGNKSQMDVLPCDIPPSMQATTRVIIQNAGQSDPRKNVDVSPTKSRLSFHAPVGNMSPDIVKNVSRVHPPKRRSNDTVAQLGRHIVRTTDGQVYAKEEVVSLSTKALDLEPLVPPLLEYSEITTSINNIIEKESIRKSSFIRRMSRMSRAA